MAVFPSLDLLIIFNNAYLFGKVGGGGVIIGKQILLICFMFQTI